MLTFVGVGASIWERLKVDYLEDVKQWFLESATNSTWKEPRKNPLEVTHHRLLEKIDSDITG